ncbi:MAG: histidine kinase [Desulfatitalea sp. BRH_c12]|nr:MAG: histidine kinase [Desulfatitalea sp. BRH_c12]
MKLPRLYTIQSRFLVGMTIAAILIGTLFAIGFYFQMRSVLENEVREKAELIFNQVESVQNYVRIVLRPRMYSEMPDKFVIEAMSSSFISRSVMQRTGQRDGQMLYRRVSDNARNSEFQANATELGLIAYFREHPQAEVWQGHMAIDNRDHFVMARPVRYEKSCLYCHGDPEKAPAELVAQYGLRGFGREEDSIGGLDFVGLPVSPQMAKVKGRVATYLIFFSISSVLFFLATQLIFKRTVSDNIRYLTRLLRTNVKDAEGQALLREVQRRDELGAMIEGVEQLGNHIAENRQKLEGYAADLEGKVNRRTHELARESAERTADVDLFVRLLHIFNRCQTRPELWRHALPLIVERFDLSRAAYVCTFASNNSFVWPPQSGTPELPDDYVQLLTQSQTRIAGSTAFIPVESSQGNTEGLLRLDKKPGDVFRSEEQEILRAIGRQLGIAAEYLGALDGLLRHSEMLQSIFEGISDPLLLVDAQGSVIITNNAARQLCLELSGGSSSDGNLMPLLFVGNDQDVAEISQIAVGGVVATRQVKLASGRTFVIGLHPLANHRLVVHVSEVTHQYRMLEQVARSEKMATVGKLAAGLAHEINNPLGVILCYTELLRKNAPMNEQREDLDIILRHTRQAREVLRNLLNFARPKLAAEGQTDLSAAVQSLLKVFGLQAEKKKARLRLQTHASVPMVGIEPQVVEHIVSNLLLNALDALPPSDGEIAVTIAHSPDNGEVVLKIMDNGTGIDPQDLPHLFDPFFTTKAPGKGAGLGLTVIYGFMQDMGGRIDATNRNEGGACFELHFPIRARQGEKSQICMKP